MELGKALSLAGMCVALSSAFIYDAKTVALSVLGTYLNGGFLFRENPFQHPEHHRNQGRSVDGLGSELPANQQKAHQQQAGVQQECDDGNGQMDDLADNTTLPPAGWTW